MACCRCCAGPMTILLCMGMMNPFVIIIVSMVITEEKLLPRPVIAARFAGILAIIVGLAQVL
ncbi:MAG TPA: DUF2182 domain-containing protein [Candidatus Kapabacteria bacterium]|nr:DUF2182 domain-containing protein [Candidatus Kapabacteria bacterium]